MYHSGETVSQTVRNLLANAVSEDPEALSTTVHKVYSKKLKQLADHLGVSHAYMPRKLKSGTWTVDDLDKLAEYFGMWPGDFLPGPH